MRVVELKDTAFCYPGGKVPVLKGLELSVTKGEHVGVLGKTGSGKSTLLGILSGILPGRIGGVLSGSGWVLGEKLPVPLEAVRGSIGVVFQSPEEMLIRGRCLEEISFSLICRGIGHRKAEERARNVIRDLGVSHLAEKRTSDLSGGEAKLVAIASALATGPSLLLLDEPTSHLDPRGKRSVLSTIERMKNMEPDLAVIQVEHDLPSLANCSSIVMLSGGKAIIFKDPDEALMDATLHEAYGILPDPLVSLYRTAVRNGIPVRAAPRRGLLREMGAALSGRLPRVTSEERSIPKKTMSVCLRGVSYRYPGSGCGISGVDLDLGSIHSLSVVGPNGAGKSTLCRTIAGLVRPDSGKVDIRGGSAFYLFQNPQLMFFADSVSEELKGRSPSIERVIDRLGLKGLEDRYPQTLSGGEQRRLGISLALTSGADLLVLDEPFSSLDSAGVNAVWELLEKEDGPPYIITTNDLEVAGRTDMLIFMIEGKVVRTGVPGEVLYDIGLLRRAGWPLGGAQLLGLRSGAGPVDGYRRLEERISRYGEAPDGRRKGKTPLEGPLPAEEVPI